MVSSPANRSANLAGWPRRSASHTPRFAIARLPDASVVGYLADGKARRGYDTMTQEAARLRKSGADLSGLSRQSARRHASGRMPPRPLALAVEWATLHEAELLENWSRLRLKQPPVKIAPLE